jgi:hypothetical protein
MAEEKEILYINKALSFTNEISKFENTEFSEAINFLNPFTELYNKEEQKLPYHVNIIDELRAGENAHSRILTKLLQFNVNGKYELLQSFIDKLGINHILQNPKITCEKERIDLLIMDKDFALIIENKVHDAVDQPAQLARYIEKVKERNYKEEQIHIVYLTKYGDKEVANQTWELAEKNYKDKFEKRFYPVSFRSEVFSWAKEYLPNCRIKDVYLKSTLEQYIDHLEGIFNLREIQKHMNQKLKQHIIETLSLTNEKTEKRISVIDEKITELNKATIQLKELKSEYDRERILEWFQEKQVLLKKDFWELDKKSDLNHKGYPHIGVLLQYKEVIFSIILEYDIMEKSIYYGFYPEKDSKVEIITNFLKNFKEINETNSNDLWYYWENTSFEKGYNDLRNLINLVQKKIEEDSLEETASKN